MQKESLIQINLWFGGVAELLNNNVHPLKYSFLSWLSFSRSNLTLEYWGKFTRLWNCLKFRNCVDITGYKVQLKRNLCVFKACEFSSFETHASLHLILCSRPYRPKSLPLLRFFSSTKHALPGISSNLFHHIPTPRGSSTSFGLVSSSWASSTSSRESDESSLSSLIDEYPTSSKSYPSFFQSSSSDNIFSLSSSLDSRQSCARATHHLLDVGKQFFGL